MERSLDDVELLAVVGLVEPEQRGGDLVCNGGCDEEYEDEEYEDEEEYSNSLIRRFTGEISG